MSMIEKKFVNEDLEIELTSFIDDKQNIWFRGKDVAEILGYSKTRDALLKHVDNEDKQLISWRPQNVDSRSQTQNRYYSSRSAERSEFIISSRAKRARSV